MRLGKLRPGSCIFDISIAISDALLLIAQCVYLWTASVSMKYYTSRQGKPR
jgi:hypothetical protein